MPDLPLLTIHTDGASRGNPGAAAFAYIIARKGVGPIEEAGCLGEVTNNVAEYTALVRALQHALKLGAAHRVALHSDSELVIRQMKGEYKVKNPDLRPLYLHAKELADRFTGGVNFVHVRRELNKRADQLCNDALDGKRGARADDTEADEDIPGMTMRDEATAIIELAGDAPAPVVWDRLVAMLKRRGVKLPAE